MAIIVKHAKRKNMKENIPINFEGVDYYLSPDDPNGLTFPFENTVIRNLKLRGVILVKPATANTKIKK